MTYYLAIDIGASSGRHILGWVENGKLNLLEIYRFENSLCPTDEGLTWDAEKLFYNVKEGIKKCAELQKIPKTIAIDTWGVDYVLLDEKMQEIMPVFAYRDNRTAKIKAEVDGIIGAERLYDITGIQSQNFNTIYQLYCDKKSGKLDRASHFMMMPDYLAFKLTGVIKNEYTNATTSSLVNANSGEWDEQLLDTLGIDKKIFKNTEMPTTVVGRFKSRIADEMGFDATVTLCPTHDTASAVCACPIDDKSVYISSGTWSLIGTECKTPTITPDSRKANFTNEGGIERRFRFLKNIMGMWLFQNIRKNIGRSLSYDEMMRLAMDSRYTKTFDCNDDSLTAPDDMIGAIKKLLGDDTLPLADVLNSVYYSLANSYMAAIEEIENIAGKKIESIMIGGGGSRDEYLNRLTAKITGRRVIVGLQEATATGNLLSQIMLDKNIDLDTARKIVKKSFDIREVL